MSLNNDPTSEDENSNSSFEAMSPASVNLFNSLSSFVEMSDLDHASFDNTHHQVPMINAGHPQERGAEYIHNVGSWTADQFEPSPAWFAQDYILFDGPLPPLHIPILDISPAVERAATLLTPPSLPVVPLHTPALGTSPPTMTANETRTISRPPPRQRQAGPTLPCSVADCKKTFRRSADRDRHIRTIHAQAHEYYECRSFGCLYRTRRRDKMQEHCQKVHAHPRGAESFRTVPEAEIDASTPWSSSQPPSTPGSS